MYKSSMEYNLLLYKISPTWLFLYPPPPSADITSLSLGRPGPLRPAADLHEQICQLVWQHAPHPLPDETGPHFVQGPGVYTAQKIQRHWKTLTWNPREPFFFFPKDVERSLVSPHIRIEQGGGHGTLSERERAGQDEADGGGGVGCEVVLNEVLLSKNVRHIIVLVWYTFVLHYSRGYFLAVGLAWHNTHTLISVCQTSTTLYSCCNPLPRLTVTMATLDVKGSHTHTLNHAQTWTWTEDG